MYTSRISPNFNSEAASCPSWAALLNLLKRDISRLRRDGTKIIWLLKRLGVRGCLGSSHQGLGACYICHTITQLPMVSSISDLHFAQAAVKADQRKHLSSLVLGCKKRSGNVGFSTTSQKEQAFVELFVEKTRPTSTTQRERALEKAVQSKMPSLAMGVTSSFRASVCLGISVTERTCFAALSVLLLVGSPLRNT